MKKLVFAIQVSVLMAMFPVYMIVELNQGRKKMTVNKPSPERIEESAVIEIQPSLPDVDEQLSYLLHN